MSKPKVLVVDDEESILDFITMALEHDGYQVVTARGDSLNITP